MIDDRTDSTFKQYLLQSSCSYYHTYYIKGETVQYFPTAKCANTQVHCYMQQDRFDDPIYPQSLAVKSILSSTIQKRPR